MLQYLTNATAIWLISLVLFDAFLRRESYHSYNRFYLIFTFLLGVIMPLVQWESNSADNISPIQVPMQKVIAAKQTIVAAGTPETYSPDWQQWLLIVYCVGAVVALCVLLADVYKLYRYYTDGKKSAQDGWTVVFTGKGHAPFSLLNLLFVGNSNQYSPDEWQMVLLHEGQHARLWHVLDLALMQLARIVFWFHPLVYIYNKRLLLVHEYQADTASATQPKVYGAFLVEQALLQASPSVSHSFNRSPIKSRIVMLNHKSTAASKMRMLVFIPLALVCIVCFSKNSFSHGFQKKGNTVIYNGNTFELSKPQLDTIVATDPVTGKEVLKVFQHDPHVIKMNGKDITLEPDQQPNFTGNDKDLRDYLLKNMKNDLAILGDGLYTLDISNILVNEKGKIVYFNFGDIQWRKLPDDNANSKQAGQIPTKKQRQLFDKVCDLMDAAPEFKPATANGKKVTAGYYCMTFMNNFKIMNHKIYDLGKDGQYKEL